MYSHLVMYVMCINLTIEQRNQNNTHRNTRIYYILPIEPILLIGESNCAHFPIRKHNTYHNNIYIVYVVLLCIIYVNVCVCVNGFIN